MRLRFLCFYLFLSAVCLCVLLLVILGGSTGDYSSRYETGDAYNENRSTFTGIKRTVVSRLKPNLNWLEKLGKEALVTVPAAPSPNCSHSIFLVILVISSPDNFQRRNAIRSSWAKIFHSEKHRRVFNGMLDSYGVENLVKTVFLLGKSDSKETQKMVNNEVALYDDIVSADFNDNYKNLVYKTRLGLTWVYSYCPSAYVLKTDDDVFVNVGNLLRWLLRSPENDFYTGWCNYHSKVSRNKLSKWYVSVKEYGEDEYPPYCLGGGYLISSDILSKIIKPTYTEHLLPLEDIVVGLAINKLNIQPVDNRKLFNLLYSGVSNLCDFKNILLLHPVNVRELLSMHLKADLAQKMCY